MGRALGMRLLALQEDTGERCFSPHRVKTGEEEGPLQTRRPLELRPPSLRNRERYVWFEPLRAWYFVTASGPTGAAVPLVFTHDLEFLCSVFPFHPERPLIALLWSRSGDELLQL